MSDPNVTDAGSRLGPDAPRDAEAYLKTLGWPDDAVSKAVREAVETHVRYFARWQHFPSDVDAVARGTVPGEPDALDATEVLAKALKVAIPSEAHDILYALAAKALVAQGTEGLVRVCDPNDHLGAARGEASESRSEPDAIREAAQSVIDAYDAQVRGAPPVHFYLGDAIRALRDALERGRDANR